MYIYESNVAGKLCQEKVNEFLRFSARSLAIVFASINAGFNTLEKDSDAGDQIGLRL